MPEEPIRAAGGVVQRPGPGGAEIVVVHRPRYDDWSLPKGKVDRRESLEEAAVREVEEETGLRCRLVRPLGTVRYRDPKGRPKTVRYWLMEPVAGDVAARPPDGEVDAVRWVGLEEAPRLLTYERDRRLLAMLE